MLLLAALVCAPIVASASKWKECICNGGFCYCNWVFGLDFRGDICNVKKPRRNLCFSPQMYRDLRRERGCTCSHQHCACQFGSNVTDSEICFHSTDVVQCVPARSLSKEERSKWVECICSGAACNCDWIMGVNLSGRICLEQRSRTVACYETQHVKGLQPPNPQRGCICSPNRCACNFGTVVKDGDICFYFLDFDRLCVPIKTSSK